MDQRDSADDRAGVPVPGGEVWQLYSGAFGPEPDVVGRELAVCTTLLVDGVVIQLLGGQLHQCSPERLGIFAAVHDQRADGLPQVVMGRRSQHARCGAAVLYGDVPEGIRRLDAQSRWRCSPLWITGSASSQVIEGDGALAVDVPGVVGEDLAFAQGISPSDRATGLAAVADLAWSRR